MTASTRTVRLHGQEREYPVRELRIPARDGAQLAATWFEPADAPRGVAFLAAAMGVPASYYRHLAAYLAEQGIAALSFDYRGFGASLEGRMQEVRASALDWAHDAADAFAHAREAAREAEVPITWIGHSLGGQLLPFADTEGLDRVLLVSAGSGWWGRAVWTWRWHGWLSWYAAWPLTAMHGYFPGRRIRLFNDMPAGPFRQIARWCLSRDYYLRQHPELAERLAAVSAPVSLLSATDDELQAEASFRWYAERFTGAELEFLRLDPAEHGRSRIGHHGLFRPDAAELWEGLLLPRIAVRP